MTCYAYAHPYIDPATGYLKWVGDFASDDVVVICEDLEQFTQVPVELTTVPGAPLLPGGTPATMYSKAFDCLVANFNRILPTAPFGFCQWSESWPGCVNWSPPNPGAGGNFLASFGSSNITINGNIVSVTANIQWAQFIPNPGQPPTINKSMQIVGSKVLPAPPTVNDFPILVNVLGQGQGAIFAPGTGVATVNTPGGG